jgi:hypothetical protein
MDGLDELLAFPTYAIEQGGGGIDGNYTIVTIDEAMKKGDSIHTDPILLVGKPPAGENTISDITMFQGSSGLPPAELVAINGEAVRKIMTNPNSTVLDINTKLFILKIGEKYNDISDIVTKQIAFICFFHHLFFLCKLAKYPNFPMFSDPFADKFNAVQAKLGDQADKQKEIFNIPTAALVTFWNTLKTSISLELNVDLFAMLTIFSKSTTEIYDWLKKEEGTEAAAAASVAVPSSIGTGTPPPSGTASGFDQITPPSSEVSGTVIEGAKLPPDAAAHSVEMLNTTGHDEAPSDNAGTRRNTTRNLRRERNKQKKQEAIEKERVRIAEAAKMATEARRSRTIGLSSNETRRLATTKNTKNARNALKIGAVNEPKVARTKEQMMANEAIHKAAYERETALKAKTLAEIKAAEAAEQKTKSTGKLPTVKEYNNNNNASSTNSMTVVDDKQKPE